MDIDAHSDRSPLEVNNDKFQFFSGPSYESSWALAYTECFAVILFTRNSFHFFFVFVCFIFILKQLWRSFHKFLCILIASYVAYVWYFRLSSLLIPQ